MTTNPVGRMDQNTPQELIEVYLAKGGNVTKCLQGARTEDISYPGSFYRKKKPVKAEETAEVTAEDTPPEDTTEE